MSNFYSCERLLNTLDINGEKPELFIVCSRVRGPGKTYSFSKKLLTDFLEHGEKFVLFARTKGELGGTAEGILKGYLENEKPDKWIEEKIRMKSIYSDIFLCSYKSPEQVERVHCGYVIPLNSADQIKKISSTFVDSVQAYFDEFQPTSRTTYLSQEVDKFLTIHGSLARGGGQSRRYYPVYFASNTISIANPYFLELGLTNKITSSTKFYRGDGFVFERCDNPGLVTKHAEAGMSRAFKNNKSIDYSDNSYLNDSESCIEQPNGWGTAMYLFTIKDDSRAYAVKIYPEVGLYYMDYNVDRNQPAYNVSLNGELNIPFLKSSTAICGLKGAFLKGQVRFKNQQIKQFLLSLLC